MRVILQVTAGPSAGRQIPLQVGELARFGRSTTADVCFPDDAHMAPVHFQLACFDDRCQLRDISGGHTTLLNDQSVTEADLHDGDTILAGSTRFATIIAGGPDDAEVEADATTDSPPAVAPEKPLSLAEICSLLEMEEESVKLLQATDTSDLFVDTLVEHQQFDDAIRLMAYTLPKREAIWWAYCCVEQLLGQQFSANEQSAMDAVLAWLKEPSEPHRRAANAAAEVDELQSAASWVALAAFWSEGSLAPPDLPEVPPDDRLTSQGVTAALLLAAAQGDFTQIVAKYRSIMKTAQKVRNGELPLPSEEHSGVV